MSGDRTGIGGSDRFQVGSHNTQINIGLDAAGLPSPQAPGADGVLHNLPPASAVFEGRDVAVLDGLLGDAAEGVVVGQAAVHGLGGIGKSELANQYARTYRDRYRLVWWVTAENRQAVDLGLAALTRRLHPVATLADAQAWAYGWLQSHTGWLLVLDNVEDIADIADLLGAVAGRGQILVTTRRDFGTARWRRLGLRTLRLDVLDRAASVRLLTELTGLDDSAGAERLADALGDLPLGLQQGAAYVSQHEGMTFDEYTRLLAEEFARAAADSVEGSADQRTVAAVWTVTTTAIGRRNPLAVTLLDVLAWYAADELPESVVMPLADDSRDVGDALAVLASYSMITRRSGTVAVHRLVQAVARSNAAAAGNADTARDTAIRLLAEAAPDDPVNDVAGFGMWATLLPHLDALAAHLPAGHDSTAMTYLQDRGAAYQLRQGNYRIAIATFERVADDRERLLGLDHPATLTARANLAVSYRQAGRAGEAIGILERAVGDRERLLGVGHPDTLRARAHLAGSYEQAGRTDEAIGILEQVVPDCERVLGAEHPETLMARANLAWVYQQAGRTDEAIGILERVVPDCERLLGMEHPDTLMARANLAVSYRQAGGVEEAIGILERVVTGCERVLGAEHPHTQTVRANLTVAYRQVGRADGA